ncbi:MAG: hypothetical protein IEMM0008_0737 [bacterium]|nr:MAG: hypothetical protein IEMM0008_0737 [bacterium]
MLKEKVQVSQETEPIVLDFQGIADLKDDDKLFDFCLQNRELRIERTEEGKLIIMLPVGGEGSSREFGLSGLFYIWNKKHKLGKVFSPTGGFILPSGAMRSPDVSFIKMDRWKAIPLLKRKKFLPICPDFIGELRSESDGLIKLKEKMTEWMANGCSLGWLIDPIEEKAYIYRPNRDIEEVASFSEKLSGEDVLPDFELDLKELREEE